MPTDIAIHELGTPLQGNHPPAPKWPRYDGEKALADDTLSKAFVISVPSVALLVSTAKYRVDCRAVADVASISPTASPEVLVADAPRFFFLAPGTYHFKTLAYA